ncbi:MAG: response regulator [Nitrospinae bacterium]|nr:response regulator [Nitrospinota bacterium]
MKKPVILCVDDEKIVITSLKEQLRRALGGDYRIETAESAEEALFLSESFHKDGHDFPVMICDQIMPGMKGDELMVRVHKMFPKTLKIMLTGQADLAAVGNAINRANLYRYIRKPWEQDDIIITVTEAIKAHFADKRIEEQNEALALMNQDIEQKLAQTQAEQTVILENAIVGIMFVKGRRIARVNQKIEELFGISRDEAVGGSMEILWPSPEDFTSFIADAEPVLMRGEGCLAEKSMKRAGGGLFWCGLYGRAINPEEPDGGVIWVAVDLTDRKKAEEALRAAKENAEKATALKDKFLSLVTHDLRSPIASIAGMLRHIKEAAEPSLNDEHGKLFEYSIASSEGLLRMIDQLLDLTRLSSGSIVPSIEKVPVNEVVATSILSHIYLAKAKGVKIFPEIPPNTTVMADADLFLEIMNNLLSNAVKFCSGGDTVTVFIPAGSTCCVAVRDTGKGIDPMIMRDIFRQEVKTTTKGTSGEKGTGLGLPLCKEIMIAHGGDITVESEPGKGSVFYVSFTPAPAERTRVLVVDDNEAYLELMKDILSGLGLSTMVAENGEQAYALAASGAQKPGLVITDINMPVMDGIELVRRLKEGEATKGIPVLVMSSEAGPEWMEKLTGMGTAGFISKPLIDREVTEMVRTVIPGAGAV